MWKWSRRFVGQKCGLEFVGGIGGELPPRIRQPELRVAFPQELGVELWRGKHQPHRGDAPATGASM